MPGVGRDVRPFRDATTAVEGAGWAREADAWGRAARNRRRTRGRGGEELAGRPSLDDRPVVPNRKDAGVRRGASRCRMVRVTPKTWVVPLHGDQPIDGDQPTNHLPADPQKSGVAADARAGADPG